MLLYAGKDNPLSLDSCLHAHYPRLSPHVVAFDIRRSPQPLGHDFLDVQPYGKLCQAAIDNRVRLICGGPNCRTWSILPEELVWGFPTLMWPDNADESKLFFANRFFTWNIPGIPWSVAPLPQLLDVPVCGPPRSSRHGIPRWVTP